MKSYKFTTHDYAKIYTAFSNLKIAPVGMCPNINMPEELRRIPIPNIYSKIMLNIKAHMTYKDFIFDIDMHLLQHIYK